jgi:hypothetical protein
MWKAWTTDLGCDLRRPTAESIEDKSPGRIFRAAGGEIQVGLLTASRDLCPDGSVDTGRRLTNTNPLLN